jgi:hypothetical protein
MRRLVMVLIVIGIFAASAGISYLFALAGEPQSVWLWRMFGVLP